VKGVEGRGTEREGRRKGREKEDAIPLLSDFLATPMIFTDHFSGRVEQLVGCVSVLSVWTVTFKQRALAWWFTMTLS